MMGGMKGVKYRAEKERGKKKERKKDSMKLNIQGDLQGINQLCSGPHSESL